MFSTSASSLAQSVQAAEGQRPFIIGETLRLRIAFFPEGMCGVTAIKLPQGWMYRPELHVRIRHKRTHRYHAKPLLTWTQLPMTAGAQ